MAAPTNAALVKKVLANSEPSTHGPKRRFVASQARPELGVKPTCQDSSMWWTVPAPDNELR